MPQKKLNLSSPQKESSATKKLQYEAPTATFVPLEVEERIVSCCKGVNNPSSCASGNNKSGYYNN